MRRETTVWVAHALSVQCCLYLSIHCRRPPAAYLIAVDFHNVVALPGVRLALTIAVLPHPPAALAEARVCELATHGHMRRSDP